MYAENDRCADLHQKRKNITRLRTKFISQIYYAHRKGKPRVRAIASVKVKT